MRSITASSRKRPVGRFLAVVLAGLLAASAPATTIHAVSVEKDPSPTQTSAEKSKNKKAKSTPSPGLVNEQLVTADLGPSGLPTQSQLFNRIVANDLPATEVSAQTSTVDLRYLDQRGAPPVDGATVTYSVGGSAQTSTSTQATFDKPLPVAFHAEYATSGEGANGVNPDVISGFDGDVKITYTATNTVVENQPITYTDADGTSRTQEQPVFAPFVGTVIATVPSDVRIKSAGTAVVSTTTEGQTALQWNLVLYPPLGNFQQVMDFEISGSDLDVPAVLMEVVPVTTDQDPAVGFSSTLLSESVSGSAELASGLAAINESTLELADGAAQLAAAQSAAAKGASEAATGSEGLALGAALLTEGLVDLSGGLDQLAGSSGLPAAADATAALAEAVSEITDIIGSGDDPPINPFPPFPKTITLVQASRIAELSAEGLSQLAASAAKNDAHAVAALTSAYAQLCAVPTTSGCSELRTGLQKATAAGTSSGLVALGLKVMDEELLTRITAGLIAVSTGLKSTAGESVYGGLTELEKALNKAAKATKELAAGSTAAAGGAEGLTAGTDELASGLSELAAGSEALVTGTDGLSQGAKQLQSEGTSTALNQVIDSSQQPAMADAYLKAASARASDASPYPPPADAIARVAYVYTLDPPAPEPGLSPAAIAIGVIALAALGLVAVRRLRRPVE